MTTRHPAAAQQSVDAAWKAAWAAARRNGGSFTHATDEAGEHRVIARYAPAEYAAYESALRAARSALRGSKYEGSVTA